MKKYWEPVQFKNNKNTPRKVGFEIEFGNVPVKETVEAVQNSLGGTIHEISPFIFEITNSTIGKLKIERDAELLNSGKYRETLAKFNIDFDPGTFANEIELGIDKLSSLLIPCEIVTEPLPIEQFLKLDDIVTVLNELHAEGTQRSVFYAFGLHINPSVPDLDPGTLLNYLQSFLMLSDWIIADSGIDFSRRFFTNFIDPFPDAYLALILDPEYRPSVKKLIDDYLGFNPTRNRALDMLPVFCEVDRGSVFAAVKKNEQSLLSSRPAFHYRLPDCRVGDKKWSIADEWNRWWYVEALAANKSIRNELIELWNKNSRQFFVNRKTRWIDTVKAFLDNHIQTPDERL
ncbi:MAG: amidoligase family protein [Desulfobacteraceae bacterium]|jgi:hypothetical protein|nr:amidoligase family protein [Desulfobacteraceae bacterium]